jgi:ribosomal protein S18 acetylase RimI-like enzyme
MLKYRVRPAQLDDLARCLEIDASYVTTHVWQMEEHIEQESLLLEETLAATAPIRPKIAGKKPAPEPFSFRVNFRPSRLPRPVAQLAPLSENQLLQVWKTTDHLAVLEAVHETFSADGGAETPTTCLLGYLGLTIDRLRHFGWISSGAIDLERRRKGLGLVLLKEAKRWAEQACLHSLMIEIQPKNYPAISFLQKNNFYFCGYNNSCYPDREIGMYFALKLPNRRQLT